MSGENFTLNASVAKAAGDQDAVCISQMLPCVIVLFLLPAFLKMAGFNPVYDEFTVDHHGRMLQAFDDGKVRIGKVSVLANHGDVDLFLSLIHI